jgi:pSer/pThr/pTyr-binding forkhead associated (FHA) protein
MPLSPKDLAKLSPAPSSAALPAEIEALGDAPGGTVSLHVQGRSRAIILRGKRELILGRGVAAGNLIDLTDSGAIFLGVSRQHAAIRLFEQGCVIEDLGSVNGTWVNGNRLVPSKQYALRSGDQIRLGRLMIVFVHYAHPATDASLYS